MNIAITLDPHLDATSLAVKAILQTYPGAYKPDWTCWPAGSCSLIAMD